MTSTTSSEGTIGRTLQQNALYCVKYDEGHFVTEAKGDGLGRAREKITQVFQFLRALNEHRSAVIRDIRDQPWSIRLADVPVHESVTVARRRVSPDDETDVILSVRRPTVPIAPPLPELLADWVLPSWRDPLRTIEHRESRETTLPDGAARTERFDDDPRRRSTLQEWAARREKWVALARPAIEAGRLFERLYDLHGQLDREGERVELVLGDGVVSWSREDDSLFHPLLLQKVVLQFDPAIPMFTITDAGGATDLYTAVFRGVNEVDGNALAARRAELQTLDVHPLGESDTNGFLRALAHALTASATFDSDEPPPRGSPVPVLGRDPVLFVRRRNLGLGVAIEAILADLPCREELPSSLLRIVGDDSGPPSDMEQEPEPASSWSEPEDVLLSKPANPEQIQIAQRLDAHGCVLVQGPPGTGKTHTIANLIGHLLANNRSVLVTSHTTKALKVLRDQVVPTLRPLCVSVLENDLQSRAQLEGAVQAIAEKLGTSSAARLDSEAAELANHRRQLLAALRNARLALVDARADEYREIVVGGQAWTPSDAARLVAASRGKDDWLPRPLASGAACPLTAGEAVDLYASNAVLSRENELELSLALPKPEEIVDPERVSRVFRRLRELDSQDSSFGTHCWVASNAVVSADEVLVLLERAVEAAGTLAETHRWKLAVVAAAMADEADRGVWDSLIAMIERVREHASSCKELLLTHAPSISSEEDLQAQLVVAKEIAVHVEAGGSLSAFALLPRPSWKRFLKAAQVVSGAPSRPEHFAALIASLTLDALRRDLRGRWDRQMAVIGAPSSSELGAAPESSAMQFVGEIRACLAWPGETWRPRESALASAGLVWSRVLEQVPPNLGEHGDLRRLRDAVMTVLPEVVAARARKLETTQLETEVASWQSRLSMWGGSHASSATVRALSEALATRQAERYSELFLMLVDLTNRASTLSRRKALLEKLDAAAPAWASAIRERRGAHGASQPPGDCEAAWIWAQLDQELERRNRVQLADLQNKIESASTELRRVTADLIDRRAWAGQVRRTTLPQQQALVGWSNTIKKIGKGTGRKDNVQRLRAAAAAQMRACKEAVPVWVMPLTQVFENFTAASRFDVVIIDEASQSDPLALMAMYLAKSVVVVGDHEQVSPSAIGQDLGTIQKLIAEHLRDIPNGHLYDGQTSVYDLARQSFGGLICLTEHFRCVPAIIEFSNQLAYEGRIKPMRESGSSTLKPAVISHRVEGHAHEKVNREEARRAAALIAAAIERPEYDGKTMGVISLVGEDQAIEIEHLLREHLSAAEYERRRLLCGNAAQFQGDERDVMFLSMVDSPQDGPLKLRADQRFKQRFNVAVSRARDQLWVVHSLNRDTDLQAPDLRRRLLDHCADPFAMEGAIGKAATAAESPFEKAVLERLIRAGFRVKPQHEVGYYRIDIVVIGRGRMLAVECDGDRFHPIEKLPEDMARQAILERLGWRFVRIRGSAFYRDPDGAMASVFRELAAAGIEPLGSAAPDAEEADTRGVHEAVVRRADELVREWDADEAAADSVAVPRTRIDREVQTQRARVGEIASRGESARGD